MYLLTNNLNTQKINSMKRICTVFLLFYLAFYKKKTIFQNKLSETNNFY